MSDTPSRIPNISKVLFDQAEWDADYYAEQMLGKTNEEIDATGDEDCVHAWVSKDLLLRMQEAYEMRIDLIEEAVRLLAYGNIDMDAVRNDPCMRKQMHIMSALGIDLERHESKRPEPVDTDTVLALVPKMFAGLDPNLAEQIRPMLENAGISLTASSEDAPAIAPEPEVEGQVDMSPVYRAMIQESLQPIDGKDAR